MHKLNTNHVGKTVGVFVGLIHLVWVILVGAGVAGRAVNFSLGMHFLSIPFTVLPFSWMGGLVLVVLSSIVGYVVGSVFALIWNKFNN
jgi:hypothetical protein